MSTSLAPIDRFMQWIASAEGVGLDTTYSDPGNWPSGKVGVGRLVGSKMGISAAAYPTLDISSLTQSDIETLYQHDYLDKINFAALPSAVALIVADAAVNQGVSTAAKILQASVDVEADGVIGPETLAAVAAVKSAPALVSEIAARRGLRYAETNNVATFGLGWFRRLTGVLEYALETT